MNTVPLELETKTWGRWESESSIPPLWARMPLMAVLSASQACKCKYVSARQRKQEGEIFFSFHASCFSSWNRNKALWELWIARSPHTAHRVMKTRLKRKEESTERNLIELRRSSSARCLVAKKAWRKITPWEKVNRFRGRKGRGKSFRKCYFLHPPVTASRLKESESVAISKLDPIDRSMSHKYWDSRLWDSGPVFPKELVGRKVSYGPSILLHKMMHLMGVKEEAIKDIYFQTKACRLWFALVVWGVAGCSPGRL